MSYNIAVVKGDGIGPEIIEQGLRVLSKIGEKFGHVFNYTEVLVGGAAIDKLGVSFIKKWLNQPLRLSSLPIN
ncbi:isocitrate/isopropylmalate family dehydrogenase [Petroclostridium sp. X23]|uniref:isocitrate/isopropylmalate family dehydrogenase n=1 Tax=Petroclostridium sp. X23 TaxID=3045146 RepID=UPI0032C12964